MLCQSPPDLMSDMQIGENRLLVEGITHVLPHPIADAFWVSDLIIVLYDPNAQTGNVGVFENLVAIHRSGETAWTAELPTTTTGECYYKIRSRDPLVALSFGSYACSTDTRTGRIVEKVFTK